MGGRLPRPFVTAILDGVLPCLHEAITKTDQSIEGGWYRFLLSDMNLASFVAPAGTHHLRAYT